MLHTIKTFPFEFPLNQAEIAFLGIPWDSSETGQPVKYGPLFIREALKNTPGFDLETKTNVFDEFKFIDLGDLEIVPANWKLTREKIIDTIKETQEDSKALPIILGGDHLITLGVLEALAEKHKKITVIDFDAHRDLMSEWMGEKYSHITWANYLLKDKRFELIQLGCRSSSKEEEIKVKKHKIKNTLGKIKGPVYLSIDLDVFDPSIAPEVGTPEPLGMQPKEFFLLLKKIAKLNVIGMDLVECSSTKINTQTAVLASNIIKKFLVYKRE